jgi:uncharacterized protein (TIGR02996 family)
LISHPEATVSDDPTESTDPWSIARIEELAPDDNSLTAARELLGGNTFPQVEATADGRGWWTVCHDALKLHRVVVRVTDSGFTYECSWNCSSDKRPCKHALALLLRLAEEPALRTTGKPGTQSAQDFEGLLRAVFANPDDDTPRLVFADFLDEFDPNPQNAGRTETPKGTWSASWSERAALIRVQCARARLPARNRRAVELLDEEHELLERIEPDLGGFGHEFKLEFRRGFVRLRASGWRAFQTFGSIDAGLANLFLTGWVESVQFQNRFSTFAAEAHALFRRAGELDFSEIEQGDIDLVQLALDVPTGVAGQRLMRVRVHPNDEALFRAYASGTTAPNEDSRPPNWQHRRLARDIKSDHLERLLRTGRVEGITELDFADATFDDRSATVLAGSDLPLTELTLKNNGIGALGAAALAGAVWFPRLLELSVTHCPFVNEGVAALGSGRDRCALTTLHLRSVGVGDPGITELATSARFPALESLDLEGNEITEAGAAALLASEHFPRLQSVNLSGNPIPATHQLRLALEARPRPEQPTLEVSYGSVTVIRTSDPGATGPTYRLNLRRAEPDAFTGLAERSVHYPVTALALEDSQLTADAATALASALAPGVWQTAELLGCVLGEKPAAVVERLCTGHRLTALGLSRSGLKYVDVYKLAQWPALAPLKVLDLSGNPMGIGGLEAILSSPHLRGVERFVLKDLNLTSRERARFEKEFGKRAEF